jgi:hypothetical protein
VQGRGVDEPSLAQPWVGHAGGHQHIDRGRVDLQKRLCAGGASGTRSHHIVDQQHAPAGDPVPAVRTHNKGASLRASADNAPSDVVTRVRASPSGRVGRPAIRATARANNATWL